MTKANSNLHRAAALLAALCLLASMALPVYAAETETEFSVSNSETIPGDDNAENDADETESDISVSNVGTSQKDADTTNEGSKTEPEISVPNSETITNSADTTDKAAGAPPAEGVTGSENTAPADNAAADKTADADKTGEDSTGSEDEAGFLNEDDSADDRTITAGNAKESDIALCAGDATVPQGTKYTFYFAPPSGWGAPDTVTVRVLRGENNVEFSGQRMQTMTKTDRNTTDGRPIYTTAILYKQDSDVFCPYGGFVWIHFERGDGRWVGMNGSGSGNWIKLDSIRDKCFVAADDDSGETGWNPSKWKALNDISVPYTKYAGQQIRFCNKSEAELAQVTAQFYRKDDNGTLQKVGAPITFGPVEAGETSAKAITIPNESCAYIGFTADDNPLGKTYYNFYGEDKTDDTIGSFTYSSANSCFIYNGAGADPTWDVPGTPPGYARIYFDATFSYMSYENMGEGATCGMPDNSGNLYCTLSGGSSVTTTLKMSRLSDTERIWYVDIRSGYTTCQFSTSDTPSNCHNGTATAPLNIEEVQKKYTEPCFYADSSDDVIAKYDGQRGGYWDEKSAIRDVEKGKTKQIVTLDKTNTFTAQKNTKYISTTLYDYYTDFELNGNNRNTYSSNEVNTQRGYVTFEQFDRALSNYYKQYADKNEKTINYPLYTGHFQPNNWGSAFSEIASNLNLYGWSSTENDTYWRFIAVNNSAFALDDKHSAGHSNDTFQGLVGNQMVNGMPVMAGTTDLAEPHFNEAFLTGTNAEKAVLGKVYKDVSFPFTQKPVFKQSDNDPESKAQYWYFDSNERSLYLKQDPTNSKYYLEAMQTGTDSNGKPIYTDRSSKNVDSSSTEQGTYGFFPFNQKTTAATASNYNYGFGAKLQFDFTLTNDGMVQVGNDANDKVPIKFFFSGDDDVWVYIDGQLVLDVGGAHGKASGLLEFGDNGKANTVTPYVSSNKTGGAVYEDDAENKFVYFNGRKVTFDKKGKIHKGDDEFTLTKGTTHTLTMFYMERGMWESNMAVAFNFPDNNELQVEKKVDVTGVNDLFKDSFKNQKIFTFNIKNLATHYVAKDTSYKEGEIKALPEETYKKAVGSSDVSASLEYVQNLPSDIGTGSAVLWSATMDDPTSAHREQRRGTLPLDSPINIKDFSYLTFDVYVEGEPTDTCALGNLYVELLDTAGKQKGCINGKGLQSSDVYGAATALHPGQWYTIRLLLNSLETTSKDFNNTLQSITVGDNFARKIYLRNFTFRSAPKEQPKPGFTTEQYDIPDYGSATSGQLENAKYAVFSSDRGNGDVVDENGQFLLQDGETVTFKDQFRRGSYIALQELTDPKLYDTSWTVYENDAPVKEVKGVPGFVTTGSVKTLENVRGTAPDDGRTEKVIGGDKNGHQIENNYVVAQKPDNTLVFRSYSGTADKDELTKLKVVFTNKVKTGKLIIRKYAAEKESLLNETFTFTVKFSDVGGQGLGVDIPEQKYECTVKKQAGGQEYGEVVIDRIPVGTRFVVSEDAHKDTNLQSVTISGGKDCAITEDGKRVRGSVVEGDTNVATATFFNTKRQLIDIEVTKQWQKQDGTVIKDGLPTAIYLKLQRTKTPDKEGNWEDVQKVKQLTDSYSGWVTTFTGLDKFDVKDDPHVNYTYRVLESATETGNNWHGDAADDVIEIDGKKYTILNNTVQVEESSTTPLKLTLTNKLQDAKYNLNITKQDAEDKTKLGGVEFKLEKLGTDGGPDATFPAVTRITSSEDADKGKCSFENLKPGSYRLTETKTAEGYTLLADAIEFTLTTDGECKRDATDFGDVQYDSTTGVYNIALTINNRKSFELPHTGADAPSLWLLIGLPALVAVLLVLVFRYNKKGGRRQ